VDKNPLQRNRQNNPVLFGKFKEFSNFW